MPRHDPKPDPDAWLRRPQPTPVLCRLYHGVACELCDFSTPVFMTNECVFCGNWGGPERLEPLGSNTRRVRFRCRDTAACDQRCQNNVLKGALR